MVSVFWLPSMPTLRAIVCVLCVIVWFLRLGRVVLRTVPCGCAFLVFRACCPCKGSGDGSCGRRALAPVGLVVSGGLTLRRPLRLAGNPAKCLRW